MRTIYYSFRFFAEASLLEKRLHVLFNQSHNKNACRFPTNATCTYSSVGFETGNHNKSHIKHLRISHLWLHPICVVTAGVFHGCAPFGRAGAPFFFFYIVSINQTAGGRDAVINFTEPFLFGCSHDKPYDIFTL